MLNIKDPTQGVNIQGAGPDKIKRGSQVLMMLNGSTDLRTRYRVFRRVHISTFTRFLAKLKKWKNAINIPCLIVCLVIYHFSCRMRLLNVDMIKTLKTLDRMISKMGRPTADG